MPVSDDESSCPTSDDSDGQSHYVLSSLKKTSAKGIWPASNDIAASHKLLRDGSHTRTGLTLEANRPWCSCAEDQGRIIITYLLVCVICLNIFIVCYEIDYGFTPVTGTIGRIICLVFVADLWFSWRTKQHYWKDYGLERRCTWSRAFDTIDVVMVILNVVDSFVVPFVFYEQAVSPQYHHIMKVLRIGRILRLFTGPFHELQSILQAYTHALSKVAWIMIFVVVVNLLVACLLAMWAKAVVLSDPNMVDVDCDNEGAELKFCILFGTVTNSLVTMFRLLTLNGWDQIADALSEHMQPWVVYPCLLYYMMTISYMATSLITGVISESLINVKEQDPWYKLHRYEDQMQACKAHILESMHKKYGEDERTVSARDLKLMLNEDDGRKLMRELRSNGVDISRQDLHNIIDIIVYEDRKNDQVSIEEFAEALVQLRGPAMASKLWDMSHTVLRRSELAHEMGNLEKNMDAKLDNILRVLTSTPRK